MSKIISAFNVMIENPHNIRHIKKEEFGDQFSFLYLEKQVWSILYIEDPREYYVSYYPHIEKPEARENLRYEESITFSTAEFKTREALETFVELYALVKNKYYNLDKVLNEILGENESA